MLVSHLQETITTLMSKRGWYLWIGSLSDLMSLSILSFHWTWTPWWWPSCCIFTQSLLTQCLWSTFLKERVVTYVPCGLSLSSFVLISKVYEITFSLFVVKGGKGHKQKLGRHRWRRDVGPPSGTIYDLDSSRKIVCLSIFSFVPNLKL